MAWGQKNIKRTHIMSILSNYKDMILPGDIMAMVVTREVCLFTHVGLKVQVLGVTIG